MVWDSHSELLLLYIPNAEESRMAFEDNDWLIAKKLKPEYHDSITMRDIYVEILKKLNNSGFRRLDVLSNSFDIGSKYVYEIEDIAYIEGTVIYNDGVTAIIKVTDRYMEGFFYVLRYNELKHFFPSFIDNDAERNSEYLCMDIENDECLFERNPDSGTIMYHEFDDKNAPTTYPATPKKVFKDRALKKLVYELGLLQKKAEKAKKEDLNKYGCCINVDVDNSLVNQMKEVDEDYDNPERSLESSLNRTVYWLNKRNCAILTAWRSEYNRSTNNRRNNELQKSLRELGYGVIRVKGCYMPVDKPIVEERSFLVIDLKDTADFKEHIYRLSEYYGQECFLYKPLKGEKAYLIGTNEVFGKRKEVFAGVLYINSSTAQNFSEVASGTISFEMKEESSDA